MSNIEYPLNLTETLRRNRFYLRTQRNNITPPTPVDPTPDIDALEISCSNGGSWGFTFPYNGTDYYFTKDASNRLAVKFRYSWGRYDGELR